MSKNRPPKPDHASRLEARVDDLIIKLAEAKKQTTDWFNEACKLKNQTGTQAKRTAELETALEKLKNEIIVAGEYWDEPEVKTLRKWLAIIIEALKGKQ